MVERLDVEVGVDLVLLALLDHVQCVGADPERIPCALTGSTALPNSTAQDYGHLQRMRSFR